MILILKPILFAFIKSKAMKQLVVAFLEGLAKSTDNTLDDQAVALVKKNLLPE